MNNTKKINLLITVFDLHFGGISNLILQTTPALMKEMNIEVVYFGPRDEMLQRYKNVGINVERIPYNGPKDLLRAGRELGRFIKRKQIDIVSTHLFIDKAIASISKFHVKFKLLSTLHSAENPYASGKFKISINHRLEDLYHNYLVDKNFAVSEASLISWKKFRGFNHKNTTVLYSGIEKLPCDKKITQTFENKVKIFVTACRFTQEKGLERLINLLNDLNNYNENWQFWIIGDGLLREKLEKLVISLNLEKKILFKGFQTELCQFYKDADFYINSSFHEALSISIIEAMSIGMPVIGSKVGGIPEVIGHDVNGYLINFNDVNEGLDILGKCINMSKEQYEIFSINSRGKFESKFSIDKYVKNFTKEMKLLIKTTH